MSELIMKKQHNRKKANKAIVSTCTYRELQQRCKQYGLRAVGKRNVLAARLERYDKGTTTSADYNKSAKVTVQHSTSYRDAQATIRYWCENLVGFVPSCKRTGWSNLQTIAQELLEADAINRTHNTCGSEHKRFVQLLQAM